MKTTNRRSSFVSISSKLAFQVTHDKGPSSIYQYSNMPRRLSGLLYLMVFSLYSSLFWELMDKKNLTKLQFCPESPGAMSEY